MSSAFCFRFPFPALAILIILSGPSLQATDHCKIVLFAGTVKKVDKPGHHDYLGGCLLMEKLLTQTPGVETLLIREGWPADESVLAGADALVFYTDGAGKQAYLQSPGRIALIQKSVEAGVGLVSIHQAVEYPPSHVKLSTQWTGGSYTALSGRGHWDSRHGDFPEHPVTRGVVSWEVNDGWLNRFVFPDDLKGITPLVWSGKDHAGSRDGGPADIVAWTYDRPDGGRSFSFSGLDAHSAWQREGLRKLMTNGILWTAGAEIPEGGAACEADPALIDSFLTPRIAPAPKKNTPAIPATKAP